MGNQGISYRLIKKDPPWLQQLEEFARWYFSIDREYCKQCKAVHKNKPPCNECKWGANSAPQLSSLGQKIFEIFQLISTQLRVSFSGVVGLDYNVLLSLLDILGIDNDEKFLYIKGINVIEREMLEAIRKKEEKRAKEDTNKNAIKGQKHELIPRSITGKRS